MFTLVETPRRHPQMRNLFVHSIVIVALTLLTQIGGLAWLVTLLFKRRIPSFVVLYTALTIATIWIAPLFGRVALSCADRGPLQVQSWMYCALNRNYVTPELAAVLADTAEAMDRQFPGTVTLVLDANFPFLDGFPLLPHLSHDDGEKADLAFFYRNDGKYIAGATRSPIGFFAFEEGPTQCPDVWPSLRWDLDWLQPLWHEYETNIPRNAAILRILAADARVGKIFIEPHLQSRFGVSHPKIRFQGCSAARHDDHIHFQLK